MKKNINKFLNIGFVISFIFILSLGFVTIMLPAKEKSNLENRQLNKIETFDLNKFYNNTFQPNLENALADQVLFSRSIKYYSNKFLNIVDYSKINKAICSNKYVHIKKNYYTYNCDNSIIEGPMDPSTYQKTINKHLKYLKSINDKDTYYYIIDRSYAYDFENNKLTIDGYNYIKKSINNIDLSHLKRLDVNSYDDYKKYFYSSDHHWNYIGSYQGYKDIINMLEGNVKVLKPTATMQINNIFNGSNSRNSGIYSVYDDFKYYNFDLGNYNVYVNNQKSKYGDYYNFINDKSEFLNYYGAVYGNDYGKILFDFNKPKKENLMIIATSYSNPINVMLASHYNKTYIYDLRYYKNFDYKEIIKENKIDKILIILSTDMLTNKEVKLEGDM